MGVAGIPRCSRGIRGNAVECCGKTAGMVLNVAVFQWLWNPLSPLKAAGSGSGTVQLTI